MTLRYLSVCSGIEAASVAWHGLGWMPVAFAEVEAFPSAVLAHRFPGVPNWGDMTKFKEWPDADIDVLVGGTPCQSFSVAGLRKGLEDPRGSLMLTYLAIARRHRPRYVVWENVPGVLSSNGGRDFGTFLGALGDLGYGWAYRVLDAQWFGVPQRRRRVFVVGCLGDARSAAAVLFERESVRRDSPPRRQAGQRAAPTLAARTRGGGGLGTDCDGGLIASTGDVSHCLNAGGMGRQDYETETLVTHAIQAGATRVNPNSGLGGVGVQADIAYTLEARAEVQAVAHALRGEGFDASEDGTGRGTPIVPVCFDPTAGRDMRAYQDGTTPGLKVGSGVGIPWSPAIAFSAKDHGADAGDLAPTLRAMGHAGSHANGGGRVAVAVALRGREGGATAELGDDKAHALRASTGGGDKPHVMTAVAFDTLNHSVSDVAQTMKSPGGGVSESVGTVLHSTAVRRLTPVECERLQGFPDGWTDIPWRGKPTAPDGPRYKALGNSMAVPVMRWLGERIAAKDPFA